MTELIFDENEDWEKRVLCSDESCVGTVGPDGKCRECGRIYEGILPEGHTETSDKPEVITAAPQPVSAETADSGDDDDWDKRVLCSDGACIGVIGPDGKCKECGKPFNG